MELLTNPHIRCFTVTVASGELTVSPEMKHRPERVSDPSIHLSPESSSTKTGWSRSYSRETVEMKTKEPQ